MYSRILLLVVVVLSLSVLTGCNSAQKKADLHPSVEHGIMIPPLAFVNHEAKEIWRGTLGDSTVEAYITKKNGRKDDIVVLTRDERPGFYKRIEYLDRGGNRNLDYVVMKIYEGDNGWRDVIIDRDNAYGLEFADKEYNDILRELRLWKLFRKYR